MEEMIYYENYFSCQQQNMSLADSLQFIILTTLLTIPVVGLVFVFVILDKMHFQILYSETVSGFDFPQIET